MWHQTVFKSKAGNRGIQNGKPGAPAPPFTPFPPVKNPNEESHRRKRRKRRMSQATFPGSKAMGIMDVKRSQARSPSVHSVPSCKKSE
jgi:hypothetical protein